MSSKPTEMAERTGRGLLSFPVTHFNEKDRFDPAAYRKHCGWLLEHEIAGLPTHETYALPYRAVGVTTYSSAIFNFMPEWALKFHKAVLANDRKAVQGYLRDFVLPYIAIRNREKGFAVSIVKAGCKLVGRPAGPVRAPLMDLKPVDLDDLRKLIEKAGATVV